MAKGNSHSRKELRLKLVSLNEAQSGYVYSGAKDAKAYELKDVQWDIRRGVG